MHRKKKENCRIVSRAFDICLLSSSFYIFPLKFSIISSLLEFFGSEILVHYFYSTLFFYSARSDSVSKCMSQVAAILCASNRITKHQLESHILTSSCETCTNMFLIRSHSFKLETTH